MGKITIDPSVSEELSKEAPETIDELCNKILEYYKRADLSQLKLAYEVSEGAHAGQIRRSGEPYISHPLGVAGILAELKLDLASVVTGLLHDVVEDTKVTLPELEQKFGPVIAGLVDGVTKISRMSFRHTHEKQGENIRKMIFAMGKDVRVVLVKLADRLHNMRTLHHMPPDKQLRIAQETLDIYAPLASRLGISSIKIELEDLSFRYLNSDQYYKLAQSVAKKRKEREQYIQEVKELLAKEIEKGNYDASIQGRPKHLYSIYKKMVSRNIDFEQVHDILAFRIIVDSLSRCYEVLGLVHSLWKPIPGRFKDFIAMPKLNNYQSLHTTVIGPEAERIEIQIRTEEMHLIAERGIAAHWKYKENNEVDMETAKKFSWLHDLVQRHQQTRDPDEFLESLKSDLFESEIYVFTPKGDVLEFPDGATPIDFAYSIHTDVGHHCVAARVNGKLVPLKYKLKNGDSIEVITSKTQEPSKDWLNHCVTTRASSKIRAFIKTEQRKRALALGKQLMEKAFRKFELKQSELFALETFKKLLEELGCPDIDDLYVKVGYGKVMAESVIEKLAPDQKEPSKKEEMTFLQKIFKAATNKSKKTRSIIQVDGMEDVLVRFGKCCTPIPGDPIVGFITRGRGITVHTASCPKSFSLDQDRRVEVQWSQAGGAQGAERQARIRVFSEDKPGLLQKMSEAFTAKGVNILSAQIRTTRDKKAVCLFDVSVRDTAQLYSVMSEIQKIKGILGVTRISQS